MKLKVAREALEIMVAEAAQSAPEEACGLLLGAEGSITTAKPANNVAMEPERHFELDPQALIDAHRASRGGGPDVLGYYHSHPNGVVEPSATDAGQAAGDGKVWAIIAHGMVRFYKDTKDGFEPLSYIIADE